MYLAPDGHEIEVADAAAAFLAETVPIGRLHCTNGADLTVAQRRSIAEMGWFALAVPEELGGSGLSAVEHALFFRELGRQCGPLDLLAQALAANAATDAALRDDLIAGMRGVNLMVADGEAFRILGSGAADYALLATPDGASLYPFAQLDAAQRPALDPANSLWRAAALPASADRSTDGRVWQLGQLGAAAMLVGIAEASLGLIVEYAKIRETFGRRIGSWQAVRHPCAEMAVRAEAARAQLWYAAAALKEGRPDAALHLDAAKHLANQAALANADTNIQLHGGIGVTEEHDAHLLLKHALVLSRLFGTKRGLLGRLLHARLDE